MIDLGSLPAVPSNDPLVDEQQAALYMALQDAETYAGWLSEKVKGPALAQALSLIQQAHKILKEVHF